MTKHTNVNRTIYTYFMKSKNVWVILNLSYNHSINLEQYSVLQSRLIKQQSYEFERTVGGYLLANEMADQT